MSLTASATVAAAQHTGATPTRRADSASTAADSLGRQQRLKTVTIAASPLRPDAPSNGIHLPAARFTDMAANSPWDVLRQAAGVEVHQQGQGPGFASDASMRGFSSDHSTDLALWIDGAPIDEPVNGHAEGYADWNLLFPRAISGIDIARGPTGVLFGDFPIAGTANVQTKERMRGSIVSFDGGSNGRADASLLTGFDHGARGGGVFGLRVAREDGFRPSAESRIKQAHARVTHDLSSMATIDGGVELYDATWHSPGFLSEDEYGRGEYCIISNWSDRGYRRRAQERVSLRVIRHRLVWRTTAYATKSRWQLFLTIPPAGGRFEGSGSQTEEEDSRYGLGLTSAATWSLPVGELTIGGESRWTVARYEKLVRAIVRRRPSTRVRARVGSSLPSNLICLGDSTCRSAHGSISSRPRQSPTTPRRCMHHTVPSRRSSGFQRCSLTTPPRLQMSRAASNRRTARSVIRRCHSSKRGRTRPAYDCTAARQARPLRCTAWT